MYRLLFDDDSVFEVPGGYKGLQIGLAQWNGKDKPKFMYLCFKQRYVPKEVMKEWENSFCYKKLLSIFVYEEDGNKLSHGIQAPDDYIEFHYEEGDLIVTYGNPLYSDEI